MCGFDKIIMMLIRVHLSLTLKFRFFSVAAQPVIQYKLLILFSNAGIHSSKVIDHIAKRFTSLKSTSVTDLTYQ